MTTISTINRAVSVDKLVEWFERAGVAVDIEIAASAVAADEARQLAERRAERDAFLEGYDAREAIARATSCELEGCCGIGHGSDLDRSEWHHEREHRFADGLVSIVVGTQARATMLTDTNDVEMTSADLRRMADEYESLPTWLRARADELDELNA